MVVSTLEPVIRPKFYADQPLTSHQVPLLPSLSMRLRTSRRTISEPTRGRRNARASVLVTAPLRTPYVLDAHVFNAVVLAAHALLFPISDSKSNECVFPYICAGSLDSVLTSGNGRVQRYSEDTQIDAPVPDFSCPCSRTGLSVLAHVSP